MTKKMSFETRFKEKKPTDTVLTVKNFFSSKGYKTDETVIETSVGTWSCRISLFMDNYFLFATNGKGTTRDFALASGYGELYERFCCYYGTRGNYFIEKEIVKRNPDFFSWKESVDFILNDSYLSDFLFVEQNSNKRKEMIETLVGKTPYVTKYTNILNGEEKEIDKKLALNLKGSNGLSAGNTFKEAFNQGMSELCERECFGIFINEEWDDFPTIPVATIQNQLLVDLIHKIEEDNKKIFIIDCSLKTKYPVIMVFMIDLISKRFTIDFGCFPVFDIALERCLTEINQNKAFIEDTDDNIFQQPFRKINNPKEFLRRNMKNSAMSFFQNDESFMWKMRCYKAPGNFYVQKNATNEEIFNYWINFIKENNLEIFVKDESLCGDMAAISIYSAFGDTFDRKWDYSSYNRDVLYKSIENSFLILYKTLTEEYNFNLFKENVEKINLTNESYQASLCNKSFGGESFLGIFNSKLTPSGMFKIIKDLTNKNEYVCENPFFEESLFTCFNNLKNVEPSKRFDYCLEEGFYKPLWNFYHSVSFEKIINSLMEGKTC